MKDKLKNTLEHEVELLGRSISVLAIAGLLVVGGASAALLNSFGTIDGQANVDQAITVNNAGETELGTFGADFQGSNSVTAGDVVSGVKTDSETTEASFTISNNLEESYTPEFTTTVDGDTTTDLQFTWDSDGFSGDEVVRTTYANYFADAGADLTGYSPSISSDGSDVVTLTEGSTGDSDRVGTWQEAVNTVNSDSYSGIYVEDGTYTVTGQHTITADGVTISAANQGEAILEQDGSGFSNTVDAEDADNLVIEGMRFESWIGSDGHNAISIKGTDSVTVRYNEFEDELVDSNDQGEWTTLAMLATNSNDVNIVNNEFDVGDGVTAVGIATGQYYDGILGNGPVTGSVVRNNSIEAESAILLQDEVTGTVVEGNLIEANTGLEEVNNEQASDYDDDNSAPDISDAYATGTNLTANRFDTETAIVDAGGSGQKVAANNNFFTEGTWDSTNSNNFEGEVDASFQTVGSIDSGESVDVAPVHEFALMANGAESYSLSTTIQ